MSAVVHSSSMAPMVKSPATYADLEALADNLIGEIVDGELYASPRPAPKHAIAHGVLGTELMGPFQLGRGGPGGWWILVEPELHLGGNVLVPDLAAWRRTTMAMPPDTAYFSLAPDWVCEVLSPSTARLDRVKKKRAYAQAGISHCWIVDPLARTLEVYRLRDGQWVEVGSFGGDAKVRVEPFDAIELGLDALWLPEPETGNDAWSAADRPR